MKIMIKHPRKSYVYLLAILTVATVITGISSFLHYRSAMKAAEDSLELEAMGIAVSLEGSLSKVTAGPKYFQDIITDGRWEGIAFIALYDNEKTTILHSNRQLIGNRYRTEGSPVAETKAGYSIMYCWGPEKVFVLYFPVHLRQEIYSEWPSIPSRHTK
jgi:hypothetical protein